MSTAPSFVNLTPHEVNSQGFIRNPRNSKNTAKKLQSGDTVSLARRLDIEEKATLQENEQLHKWHQLFGTYFAPNPF